MPENQKFPTPQNVAHSESENHSPIEGAHIQPPQFKVTAKMHNTVEPPYESLKDGGRFAFGKSADTMDESNMT